MVGRLLYPGLMQCWKQVNSYIVLELCQGQVYKPDNGARMVRNVVVAVAKSICIALAPLHMQSQMCPGLTNALGDSTQDALCHLCIIVRLVQMALTNSSITT